MGRLKNRVGMGRWSTMADWLVETIMSVRGAIAGMCLVIVFITGLGITLLGKRSCDDALSRTRDRNIESIGQCFNASTDALTATTTDMLFYSSSAAEAAVYQYLQRARIESARINLVMTTIEGPANKTEAWLFNQSSFLWHQMATIKRFEEKSGVEGHFLRASLMGVLDATATMQIVDDTLLVTHTSSVGGAGTVGDALDVTGAMNGSVSRHINGSVSYELARGDHGESVWGMDQIRWGSIETLGGFTGATMISRLSDPALSVDSVYTMTFLSLENIRTFLTDLQVQTQNRTGADTRIFTTIASCWMVKEMERLGYPEELIRPNRQENLLTSVSKGTGQYSNDDPNMPGPDGAIQTEFLRDTEADDAVIRGIAAAVHNFTYNGLQGYEAINQHTNTSSAELHILRSRIEGSGTSVDSVFRELSGGQILESYFVTVRRIVDVPQRLDWWLTVTLNKQHVLASIQADEVEVRESTVLHTEDVSNEIDDKRMQSQIFIVSFAVFLILMSVLATHFVLRPIDAIQNEMANVAKMNLTDTVSNVKATSPFHEVRAMQANFLKMAAKLGEIRPYLPGAVLGSDTSLKSDSLSGSAPQGEVSIMFTDIQGSTELWKRSAQDMNAAIEQHNAIIRAVYREYDGYEVKTIGDSFMLSFQDTISAVNAALEIQHRFKQAKWPERLRLPAAGLVVRIGLHHGSTIAEENPITGRVDYRGSTVNEASRIEAKALGGTICISRNVMWVIKAAKNRGVIPHHPVLCPLGKIELRGLGETEVFLITPDYLKKRYTEVSSDCTVIELPVEREMSVVKDVLSDGDGSSHSDNAVLIGTALKRTELFLIKTRGTVVMCKLSSKVYDDFNLIVRCAAEAAISFDGQIAAVVASEVLITFNASKRCRQHVTSALRLAEYLETRTQSIMRLGIATGDFLHGNVGTSKQRYTTSLGTPLIVAEAAAEYAEEAGFYALFADATRESNALADPDTQNMCECLFLCDVWYYSKMNRKISLWHLSTQKFVSLLNRWVRGGEGYTYMGGTMSGFLTHVQQDESDAEVAAVDLFLRSMTQNVTQEALQVNIAELHAMKDDCALALHHATILSKASIETLRGGYRVEVSLSRAPTRSTRSEEDVRSSHTSRPQESFLQSFGISAEEAVHQRRERHHINTSRGVERESERIPGYVVEY